MFGKKVWTCKHVVGKDMAKYYMPVISFLFHIAGWIYGAAKK